MKNAITTQTAETSKSQMRFWFSLSLFFAIIYSLLELKQAFSSAYVVQDDARVYVFWMQRFLNPSLLPNDLIADYFQSVTPFGYAAFYQLLAHVGIEPLLLSKLLPVFLRLLTTGYCFALCLQILPLPAAGFITTLLLNQNLSLRDDLVSATPRAFIYLLFLAFLYYLLRRSLLPCLGAIALLGLFYPPFLFIIAGILILRLWCWKGLCNQPSSPNPFSHEGRRGAGILPSPPLGEGQGVRASMSVCKSEMLPKEGKRLRLSDCRLDYVFCFTGLGLSLLLMLPYALSSSEFGPIVTGIEARALPEFSPQGRIPFFDDNPLNFWIFSQHSGLLPNVFEHPLSVMGLFLPLMTRYPYRFPLVKQVTSNITILPQIALASVGMFVVAHIQLYKFFSPARYTRYTLKFVMIIAAGIVIIALWDAVYRLRGSREQGAGSRKREFLALGLTVLFGTVLIFSPNLLKNFPNSNYIVGKAPEIYEFFREQPKDILIASLSEEADNLPTFSKRAILIGWEYAVPYHVGFERQIRQRATDLIHAQYTQNLAEIQNFIQKYKVNFFMLDKAAFTPEYITNNPWFKQWQRDREYALATLEQVTPPALASTLGRCSVVETKELIVLQAECVARTP